MKKIFAFGTLAALLVVSPLTAFALPPGAGTAPVIVNSPTATGGAPITSGQGIVKFVNFILGWAGTIFWILAVIFVFYAAFLYLTAAGDETKVETAGHVLWYAVIAIVVGLLAYGLPVLVKNILGGA